MAKNIGEMNAWFNRLIKEAPELMEDIVEEAAIRVDAAAKKNCPVDTGNLRASITMDVRGNEATVGTNVEYAPYVEYGTSKQKKQPFLTPAKQKVESELDKIIVKEIKNYVRD